MPERANLCSFLAEDCRIYSGATRGKLQSGCCCFWRGKIRQTVKGCRDKKEASSSLQITTAAIVKCFFLFYFHLTDGENPVSEERKRKRRKRRKRRRHPS